MTLFTTDELTTYQEWIQQSKRGIKKSEVQVLRNLDSLVMAYKSAILLQPAIWSFKPLVPTCMHLGAAVLQGFEDPLASQRDTSITRFKVGYHLVNVLIEQDILTLRRGHGGGRDVYLIRPKNEEFIEALFKIVNLNPIDTIHINARPLATKPEPFMEFNHKQIGQLVRHINPLAVEEFSYEKCPKVFDAINKHMEQSYVVNNRVLEVLQEVQDDDPLFTLTNKDVTEEQEQGIKREMQGTMDIAQAWKGKEFWEALFYDNRGRMYSSAVYLSHQGSKLSKSLLKLSKKTPLGPKGLDWIYVHAANCFGKDKLTIKERIQFTKDNLPEWRTWGKDPVNLKYESVDEETGEITEFRPWTKADDPFNFLAVLLEILDLESGAETESNLIVAFDATCSGLQVLSSMSRDSFSGKMCNLTETDEIGDYYKTIADELWKSYTYTDDEYKVYEAIMPELTRLSKIVTNTKGKARKEAIENSKAFQEDNAEAIKIATRVFWGRPEIKEKRRKLVKRGCMTYFYSCQARTMSQQLLRDFKTDPLYEGLHPIFCFSLCGRLYHICKNLMDKPTALMELFIEMGLKDYRKGYRYLLDGQPRPDKTICDTLSPADEYGKFIKEQRVKAHQLGLISESNDRVELNPEYVEFGEDFKITAPYTDFFMMQNYRQNITERVKVWYKTKWLTLTVAVDKGKKLNYKKIANATSPNVVHMLDSQIVAKTILETDYEVSCIHDSFGSTAGNADKLYVDVRIAFRDLFADDVLAKLVMEKGMVHNIEYGDLDIFDVYNDNSFNQYTFS